MGIFGGQVKNDSKAELEFEMGPEPEELPTLPKPRSNTVIAKGLTVTGALHGEGVVQVEGTVEGELNLQGSVFVTPTGLIKGPVTADVVRVAGCLEGSVSVRSHLWLEKTGVLEGDVTTPSMVVEDGGRLNGRSTMITPPEEPLDASAVPPVETLEFGANYPVGESEN